MLPTASPLQFMLRCDQLIATLTLATSSHIVKSSTSCQNCADTSANNLQLRTSRLAPNACCPPLILVLSSIMAIRHFSQMYSPLVVRLMEIHRIWSILALLAIVLLEADGLKG